MRISPKTISTKLKYVVIFFHQKLRHGFTESSRLSRSTADHMLRFNKRGGNGDDHLLRFARAMGMRYGRSPSSEEHMLRFGRAGPDQGRKSLEQTKNGLRP